jgi:hypothetical protein
VTFTQEEFRRLAQGVTELIESVDTLNESVDMIHADQVRETNARIVEAAELRRQNAELVEQNVRLEQGRRRNRRLASLAIGAAVIGIVAGGVAGWSVHQSNVARDAQRKNQDCVNAQNDARAKSSQDFYQHIDDLTSGQLGAFQRAVAHPDQAPQAVTDYINATSAFHDYAQVRLAQLSAPPKGC